MADPTYGDLIQYLNDSKNECSSNGQSVAEVLAEKFTCRYPHIPISRPNRFLDTVKRIAAPTLPSTVGKPKLVGSPLSSYLRRHWVPRTRHKQGSLVFPSHLEEHVSESVLQRAFIQCANHESLCWTLDKSVTIGFYKELHNYLQKWPPSQRSTKTTVGRFYLLIDSNFLSKRISTRPDNIYMFVQRIADSSKIDSEPMSYGVERTVEHLQSVVSGYQASLDEMSQKMSEQQKALQEMQTEMDKAKAELMSSRRTLCDISNKLEASVKQRNCAHKKLQKSQQKIEGLIADSAFYEDEILAKQDALADIIVSLKNDLSAACTAAHKCKDTDFKGEFCLQTKEGQVYTTAIRELYYKLLAEQLPPAKIATTIRSVLKSFLPTEDVDSLKLPGESCASYMRREELTTVNLAHKATCLLDKAQSGSLDLNCDCTTLNQKKLQGAVVGGMVLSVNEIPDGSADRMIADISQELLKLREIAHKLQLPNAKKINWTLIQSSSSDSASTQKRFNILVKQKREEDAAVFGPICECPDVIELVENFCCMHLGVNLRRAFFKTSTDKHSTDVLVHEFCKLLGKHGGKHGVPEYGHGVVTFPDFLQLMCSSSNPSRVYYEQCAKVKLDRQVGSRYFVTAANAGKILVLREAAISFLEYTGKNNGNKLERSVYDKLQDLEELTLLKADAVMFHHIYCNLVMLAKSNDLKKNVLDMNNHYLELQLFLTEMEQYPEVAMDCRREVFVSETRLYGADKKLNHRLHNTYDLVEKTVFSEDDDNTQLYSLLASGATSMKDKLMSYAQNQLPEGKYWKPEPDVEAILKSLRPNNDVCESILGLNDYLSTALPNLHQMSKSNLVQAKKNKTIQWLDTLPSEQQDNIVNLARKSRVRVAKVYKEAELQRSNIRQDKLVKDKMRRDALAKREAEEREQLTKLHLITSTDELKSTLSLIDEENISTAKKTQKKRAIIREQINIRRKVLGQKVNVPFSYKRKQRSLSDIVKEFSAHLNDVPAASSSTSTRDYSSESLVGLTVLHKFEVDGQDQWFTGFIVSYNVRTNLHEIAYEEEEEHYFFNLLEDISNGDLIVHSE